MYVILVNEDDTLITTQKDRIMQRSKLVNSLWFLVPPKYNELNMAEFTVLLEYVLPVSRKYRSEILTLSQEAYNNYLVYELPIDTMLTDEPGDIELYLSFIYVEMDENGNGIQRVRKTSSTTMTIVPISAWSDIIPDSALSALDQRIIKIDAQIKALNDIGDSLYYSKADDLKYDKESNELQLLACGNEIGSKVVLSNSNGTVDNGVPAVEFNSNENINENNEANINVVNF